MSFASDECTRIHQKHNGASGEVPSNPVAQSYDGKDIESQLYLAMQDEIPYRVRGHTSFSPGPRTPLDSFRIGSIHNSIDNPMNDDDDDWIDVEDEQPRSAQRVIDFLREFRQIDQKRQDATMTRLKVRQQKNLLNNGVSEVLEAAEALVKIFSTIMGERKDAAEPLNHALKDLQSAFSALKTQRQVYDVLEDHMMQSDYEVQMSEEHLYKQILEETGLNEEDGSNVGDQNLALDKYIIHTTFVESNHLTAEQKLLRLRQESQHLGFKYNLLLRKFKLLSKATKRSHRNTDVDMESQQLISEFARDRGIIWKEMAILDHQINILEHVVADRSELFYSPTQFSNLDNPVEVSDLRTQQTEEEPLLAQIEELSDERSNDLRSILELQIQDSSNHLSLEQLPQSPEHHLGSQISSWLLVSLESSFRSFMQYFFLGWLENSTINRSTAKSLLHDKWLSETQLSICAPERTQSITSPISSTHSTHRSSTQGSVDGSSISSRIPEIPIQRRVSLPSQFTRSAPFGIVHQHAKSQ